MPSIVPAPPTSSNTESLLVLSDVHLGSDLNDLTPPEARIHRAREVDQDLVRLLRHYRDAAAPNGRWRLVIAGDFIDFIGITVRAPDASLCTPKTPEEEAFGIGNAEDHAREKMRRVAARHADIFAALASFVAAGHALTLVHGNHDLELHWDGVRQEMRNVLREHAPSADEGFDGRIGFQPWFYYVDGVAYIEHGHQYDAYCATELVMEPRSPLDPRRIMRGFSDVLLRRVVRPTPGVREHGHENLGIVDYIMIGARLGLGGMFRLGFRFLGAVLELFRLRRQHFAAAGKALREEHERRMALLARATRIGIDRLRSIAALQVPPVTRSIRGILASVLLDKIALGLLCSVLVIVLGAVAVRHGQQLWLLPASVAVGWAITHRFLTRARQIDPTEVLTDRAAHLAKLFPVAFVVMGHTHVPAQVPVSASATYINLGAWAEEEAEDPEHAWHAPRTHLVIRMSESGRPVADLLAWDTATGAPRVFESS